MRGRKHSAEPGRALCLLLLNFGAAACADELPEAVANYRQECLLMAAGIPKTKDDPHQGVKDVYACDVSPDFVRNRVAQPFPDGTLIVKESTREDADFPWLVATAKKSQGQWSWNEYSRNFSDEPFLSILPGEQVCIDCHKKAAPLDWIYTRFSEAREASEQ